MTINDTIEYYQFLEEWKKSEGFKRIQKRQVKYIKNNLKSYEEIEREICLTNKK